MAVVLFGSTVAATAVIYAVVIILAGKERGRSFKAVSPGLLPPLGIIFGLFVASRQRKYGTIMNGRRLQSIERRAL
jgi:hypothetical protein